jgi:hypothetical protein
LLAAVLTRPPCAYHSSRGSISNARRLFGSRAAPRYSAWLYPPLALPESTFLYDGQHIYGRLYFADDELGSSFTTVAIAHAARPSSPARRRHKRAKFHFESRFDGIFYFLFLYFFRARAIFRISFGIIADEFCFF